VIVLNDARRLGWEIDEANFKRQYERALEEAMFGGVRTDTIGYALWALDIGKHAVNEQIDRLTDDLLSRDRELGIWQTTVNRPPAESSKFTTNYVAIRGLNRYAREKRLGDVQARTNEVRKWLELAQPTDTEDLVFGLRLAHELQMSHEITKRFVAKLTSEQRDDGGWGQIPDMNSDAYATGSALVALHEAGGVSCTNSSWQAGIAFLLRAQQPDGSWRVATRVTPLQDFFESGFPHGRDQFISAFATGWATDALLVALANELPSQ
jgi:N-acyl-D-amino-acid deacylase